MRCASSCLSALVPCHAACPDAPAVCPVPGSHAKGLTRDALQPTNSPAVARWALKLLLCHNIWQDIPERDTIISE